LEGAAVAIAPPVGWRTAPSAPYSGSAPSSRLKIDSVSATSRLRPRPSPPFAASRRQSAAMTPKAA
jgi:hypothetical protein